jgi:5-enolpyruvylshikimate-3-phosphate synthase
MQPLLLALRQLGINCFSARKNDRAPIIVQGGGIKGKMLLLMGLFQANLFQQFLFLEFVLNQKYP